MTESMSDSIWSDPRITSYVLDELSDSERKEFETELESNADLATAVTEARGITGQLQGIYDSESTPPLEDDRRDAIVGAISDSGFLVHKRDDPSKQFRPPAAVVPLGILAMAAILLLMVGLAPWLRQRKTIVAVDDTNIVKPRDSSDLAAASSRGVAMPSGTDAEVNSDIAMDTMDGPAVMDSGPAMNLSADAGMSPPEDMAPEMVAVPEAADSDFDKDPFTEMNSGLGGAGFGGAGLRGGGLGKQRGPSGSADVAAEAAPVTPGFSPAPPSSAADPPATRRMGAARTKMADKLGLPDVERSAPGSSSLEKMIADARQQQKRTRNASTPAPAASPLLDKLIEEARPEPSAQPRGGRGSARGMSAKDSKTESPPAELAKEKADKKSKKPNPLSSIRIAGEKKEESDEFEALSKSSGEMEGFGGTNDQGEGPGKSGDQHDPIVENKFMRVADHPRSTFSVDVDTASYSKVRDYLLRAGSLPRVDAVRIEELINYFDYGYDPPAADAEHPFVAQMAVTGCPWNQDHRLARIAIKGKTLAPNERPPCNLVFLLDTSGSMDAANKLPLVIDGMKMLTDQLSEKDRVAVAVYAGAAGLVLNSVPASNKQAIDEALADLKAGGSTNGGEGIKLAYQVAKDNFIKDGVNRVILCTDGDFNVGLTGNDSLEDLVVREAKSGVFVSVLGFGMGNHNDAMLELISGRGNGNYAFIDSQAEAKKVLVDQTSGTLVTIAKDVKLQLEFNPKQVSQYRLIGYENRMLKKEDFNNDKKDAGEIGAGHSVTALYEIVPAGIDDVVGSSPEVDDLKYQKENKLSKAADSGEMLTLKLRYKMPDEDTSTKVEFPVSDKDGVFDDADESVRFAAAVAAFGMKLRDSKHVGNWTLEDVLSVAKDSMGDDPYQSRAEFVELVEKARELRSQQ